MAVPIIEFEEVELDRRYTEVARGGGRFETSIIGNRFGVTQRNVGRLNEINRWTVDFKGLSDAELEDLREFFITKYGMAIGFRFWPPSDNTFRDDLCSATGSTVTWALYRRYTNGSVTVDRRIVKPNDVALTVKYDGIAQNFIHTVDYSIETEFGYLQLAVAPPLGVTVSVNGGSFDVPVTFAMDEFEASDQTTFRDWPGVSVVEILPVNLGLS